MKTTSYHFVTHWQVEAMCKEVYSILKDTNNITRWWPSVYLDAIIKENGAKNGLGKVVQLFTKGWLPYTLIWQFRVTEIHPNDHSGFSLEAFGDFVGRGTWTFKQHGKNCDITYDWSLQVEKPLLKYLSFMMKPLFSANHHWAMQKGFESLVLELRRQRGEANVPLPPPPTFPHNLLNNKILR
jgi:hypothetical protein